MIWDGPSGKLHMVELISFDTGNPKLNIHCRSKTKSGLYMHSKSQTDFKGKISKILGIDSTFFWKIDENCCFWARIRFFADPRSHISTWLQHRVRGAVNRGRSREAMAGDSPGWWNVEFGHFRSLGIWGLIGFGNFGGTFFGIFSSGIWINHRWYMVIYVVIYDIYIYIYISAYLLYGYIWVSKDSLFWAAAQWCRYDSFDLSCLPVGFRFHERVRDARWIARWGYTCWPFLCVIVLMFAPFGGCDQSLDSFEFHIYSLLWHMFTTIRLSQDSSRLSVVYHTRSYLQTYIILYLHNHGHIIILSSDYQILIIL